MTTQPTDIDRIWPQPGEQSLDDDQLLSSYETAGRPWLRVAI